MNDLAETANDMAGQVALVSGGSSGIGEEVARELQRYGVRVGVLDLSAPSQDVHWAECDVANSRSVSSAMGQVERVLGPPQILVHCAGLATVGTVGDTTDEDWHKVIDVNLSGAFFLIREAMPGMIRRGYGRVVAIGSGTGSRPIPERSAYASAKAGLLALIKVVALEGARSGVTANVVSPGLTDTPATRARYGSREGLLSVARDSPISNPMEEVMAPADIAQAVCFFCRPSSERITGQTLHVSGGSVMP